MMQNISGNQKNNKIQTLSEYFCSHILFKHLILITCSFASLKSQMTWPHRMKYIHFNTLDFLLHQSDAH